MVINIQHPEPRQAAEGKQLDVHSIFHTIQGEGPFSGLPAVFIRLGGCNLQCPGCDTEYTRGRRTLGVTDLANEAESLWPPPLATYTRAPLYVITGGEPLRQNISPLCKTLIDRGAIVQIETNGTFGPPPEFPKEVRVVCSPKAPKVAEALRPLVMAYKYVLDAHAVGSDGLPCSILGRGVAPARPHPEFKGPVYLSPLDAQDPVLNKLNTEAAVQSCLRFGYILNLQVHKLVNQP